LIRQRLRHRDHSARSRERSVRAVNDDLHPVERPSSANAHDPHSWDQRLVDAHLPTSVPMQLDLIETVYLVLIAVQFIGSLRPCATDLDPLSRLDYVSRNDYPAMKCCLSVSRRLPRRSTPRRLHRNCRNNPIQPPIPASPDTRVSRPPAHFHRPCDNTALRNADLLCNGAEARPAHRAHHLYEESSHAAPAVLKMVRHPTNRLVPNFKLPVLPTASVAYPVDGANVTIRSMCPQCESRSLCPNRCHGATA